MRSFWAVLLLTMVLAVGVRGQSQELQDKYKNGRPGAAESPTMVMGCPGNDSSGNPIVVACPGPVTYVGGQQTIVAGGVAQNAFATGTATHAFDIGNPSTASETLYFAIGSTASAASIPLLPGEHYHGSYPTAQVVSVFAATTGHSFTAIAY